MQRLIDATVKFRQQHNRGNPASIETICDHLDDVYKAVQYENHGYNKSYSGIRAQTISTTINLLLELEVYSGYLLENEILDSDFFVVLRDIIGRAFKETRHEHIVSEDEKKLLMPVCDIILRITNAMTPELADSRIIPLFYDKTFVLSMADGLKAFASNRVLYGAEQKAMVIKAILNMFSEYCLTKGDAATSTAHLISLVNAALSCIASTSYCRIFNYEMDLANRSDRSSPKTELFLDVCPKYIVRYKRARHEAMFAEAKLCVVQSASKILPRFISQIDRMPEELLERVLLLMELLLLIPSDSFTAEPNLIKDLIRMVAVSETDWMKNSTIKRIVHRSISLVYTLTIDMDLCKVIKDILAKDNMMAFFGNLSSNSSDKHVRFTSALISWTMNREDTATREYSPAMIKTYVQYLHKCTRDPLQQCHGVPIDTMITTLTGMVENDNIQEELVKQDAIPTIMKCATDTNFDTSTVQQPALESLWTMVFMPEVLLILSQSQEFLAHLKSLLQSNKGRTDTQNEELLEKMKRIADGLLWEIREKPDLLTKKTLAKLFKYDIMISYQRQDEAFSEKLCNQLRDQNKLRVWFDERDLYGSIMTEMAEAIETSEIVIIVLSKNYQDSLYCRSEAIYASKIQRPIIPIKLHQNFKPSSWLGLTMADRYYPDFAKKSFDLAYQELIKQIELNRRPAALESENSEPGNQRRSTFIEPVINFVRDRLGSGRAKPTNVLPPNNLVESSINSFESVPFDTSLSIDSGYTNASSASPVDEWNCDRVKTFLRINGFEEFLPILPADTDGNDLCLLYSMCTKKDNNIFEKMNEANPNIKLLNYLAFVKALRNLIKETQATS